MGTIGGCEREGKDAEKIVALLDYKSKLNYDVPKQDWAFRKTITWVKRGMVG